MKSCRQFGTAQYARQGLHTALCGVVCTYRLHSSSFLGIPYRILTMNPKNELQWSLWVVSCMMRVMSVSSEGHDITWV